MDSKVKGKSWVGSIYHQFESICQDVDDFMSKDTVRYVENQVQNVGVSVKRLYSHVVQDIIPPSGDNVEAKAQSVTGKHVETPTAQRELSLKQVSIDDLRNSNASPQIAVMQFTETYCANPSQIEETDKPIGEDGDDVVWNDADEGNMIDDLMPSSKNNSISMTSSEGHRNSMISSRDAELLTVEKERISCNSFSDNVECLSDMSRLTIVEDPDSNKNRSLSSSPEASVDKAHEENIFNIDSPYAPACDAAQKPLEKDGILFDSVSTKDESFDFLSHDQSSDLVFSYFSCDDEERETGVVSSSCPTPQKCSDNLEPSPQIFTKLADHISCTSSDYNVSTGVSTLSSATEADETKATDMAGDNGLMTHWLVSELASYESRHKLPCKGAEPNFALPPSETGKSEGFGVDISDVDMETVDLSPDVKQDVKSVVLNGNIVHSLSHRRRNFRYYKKLLQDAFASRKRLSKEYEHLAILYGDIDMESSRHFEPSSLPSSPTISLQAGRSLSFRETCESEWELL